VAGYSRILFLKWVKWEKGLYKYESIRWLSLSHAEPLFICPLDTGTALAICSSDLQTYRKAGRHEEPPLKSGAGCVKGTSWSDLRIEHDSAGTTAGSRLSRTVIPIWRDKF